MEEKNYAKKEYLDYKGLVEVFSLIKGNYVNKNDSLTDIDIDNAWNSIGKEEDENPSEEDKTVIHLIGTFASNTPEEERYVWINGIKHTLDEKFNFVLKDTVWKFGEILDGVSPWFGNGLKTLTYVNGMNEIENAKAMFSRCTALEDISGLKYWDTSKLTNLRNTFLECESLKDISPVYKWNVSKVTTFFGLFNKTKIETADLSNWNPQIVEDFSKIFFKCLSLQEVNFANWDFENIYEFSSEIFAGCDKLNTIVGPIKNWKIGQNLSASPLTVESAMVFINGLKEGVSDKVITFSSGTYDSLTPEQIAIATEKGWTVKKP